MQVIPLTPRLEEEIASFANVLNFTPADVIMGVFDSPPPKSDRPLRWHEQKE